MDATLTLVSDQDAALAYLTEARKHHTQAAIAKHLGVGVRTISRWEARQTNPPAYRYFSPALLGEGTDFNR